MRTYRLCQRVLMFHHFPDELGAPECLVRSTGFDYRQKAIGSFITRVTHSGYRLKARACYLKQSLPAPRFDLHGESLEDDEHPCFEVKDVGPQSLANLPEGIDGKNYRWLDLDGEGISGVFSEQSGAWFFKPNIGDGQLGATEVLPRRPSLAAAGGGRQQFMDLSGDGKLDLVDLSSPTPGYYERTVADGWGSFCRFHSLPVRDWNDPNLKFVDVTGDGLADVLITQNDAFSWHPSLCIEGFGAAVRVRFPLTEESGPHVVFADGTQSIYLADMSGDGLSDLVRIRNGEVCYWPNVGYGCFGEKVTMDNAPWFDEPDLFDQDRIRLADTDGLGITDIIYVGRDNIRIYLNETGSALVWRADHRQLPRHRRSDRSFRDRLPGPWHGVPALVVASARRRQAIVAIRGPDARPEAALAQTRDQQPGCRNSHRIRVFDRVLSGRQGGRHPVGHAACVSRARGERVETYDFISRNRFVTSYSYHHGYFDGPEREFRGFGRVDQLDTEEFGVLSRKAHIPRGPKRGRRLECSPRAHEDLVPYRRISGDRSDHALPCPRVLPRAVAIARSGQL